MSKLMFFKRFSFQKMLFQKWSTPFASLTWIVLTSTRERGFQPNLDFSCFSFYAFLWISDYNKLHKTGFKQPDNKDFARQWKYFSIFHGQMFRSSCTWHKQSNQARVWKMFLKVNSVCCICTSVQFSNFFHLSGP